MSTEPNSKSEVLESWEEIDEVQLDSTVNRLKDETMKSRIEEERFSAPVVGVSLVQTIQKPVVILRRPQASTTNGTSSGTQEGQKPKTQIKSLVQRQQEYAEARMRILGSMPDEEDTVTVTTTPPTINMNGTTRNPHGPGSGNGFLLRR